MNRRNNRMAQIHRASRHQAWVAANRRSVDAEENRNYAETVHMSLIGQKKEKQMLESAEREAALRSAARLAAMYADIARLKPKGVE